MEAKEAMWLQPPKFQVPNVLARMRKQLHKLPKTHPPSLQAN